MGSSAIPVEKLAEQAARLIASGGTLGMVHGYTDRDCEAVYAIGHQLYGQARYSDAMTMFGFLVMHNPYERRFMSAFAASLQMCKRYGDAILYYSMASVMDMADPLPTFHTAECMVPLGMIAEAKQALGFVLKQCDRPEREPLKQRAQALLDLLEAPPLH